MSKRYFSIVFFLFYLTSFARLDTLRGIVQTVDSKIIPGATIVVEDRFTTKTNKKGEFTVLIESNFKGVPKIRLVADGFQLHEYTFDDESYYMEIVAKKGDPMIVQVEKEIVENLDLPDVPEPTDVVDSVLNTGDNMALYKSEISHIVEDLKIERKRIEESNRKIQAEIIRISEKLKNEKLNPEQRAELERYIATLEATINENNQAFQKSQQKTAELIAALKSVIMEKEEQLAKAEKEKEIATKKMNRNLVIFSIISSSLLLLALVFYMIAAKMKKQKKALEVINKDLLNQKELITTQNEKLDIFVYRVAHDLKGPLRSIVKLAELAKIDKESPPEEIISHIGKSAEKLTRLVEDMLRISMSKNDTLEIRTVRFDELINDIIERLGYLPEAKGMSISSQIQEAIQFESDERVLLSIIQNLVENSIKYQDRTKDQRSVKVSVTQSSDEVRLIIADNGIGIEESKVPKIFDMFFRANSNTSGTGLGLHITKMNVEKLGGTIAVDSKFGVGSTFSIVFPSSTNIQH
ncbi:MAG: ATP-binding protein [Cytophagaceae bacterium]|jgi:signal transduction histidine kinase|nr:ATP-binding protein [Cytophagaceae bacterium]